MKRIKSFRISEQNIKFIKDRAKRDKRSEGYIVNQALEYFSGEYWSVFSDFLVQNGFEKTDRGKIKKLLDKIRDKDFNLEEANLEFCNIILPSPS